MDTVQVNPELCDGCGQCTQVCAVECIRIEEGKAIVGPECILCFACAATCPQGAIIEPELPKAPTWAQRPRFDYPRPWMSGSSATTDAVETGSAGRGSGRGRGSGWGAGGTSRSAG